MKIKSLLLGSAAAVAMSSAAVAGGAPVLGDICDELGITGITISSSDTCLQISGSFDYEVEFEASDFTNDEDLHFATDVAEATVGFLATQASDYGPAQLFIKLKAGGDDLNDASPFNGDPLFSNNVFLDEAWVSAGGFTAGLKGDLDDDGGDEIFSYTGLLRNGAGDGDGLDGTLDAQADNADPGSLDNHFLVQFTTELGEGIGLTVSLEDLDDTAPGGDDGADIAGQLTFDQAAFSGHIFAEMSDVHDDDAEINVKGILNFNIDDYGKVRIAGGWEDNANTSPGVTNSHLVASFETMVDVVTLAISGEVYDGQVSTYGITGEASSWSLGGSAAFGAADGVTLTVGGWFGQIDPDAGGVDTADAFEIGVKADVDVADDLVLTLEALHNDVDADAGDVSATEVSAELVWKPTSAQTWNAKVGFFDQDSDFNGDGSGIFGEIGASSSF